MAKLTLDVESNALGVFGQAVGRMDDLRSGVESFQKEGTASFKKVTDEAGKLTDEVKHGSKGISDFVEETIKMSKGANIIKELKKQVKEYESAAIKAGEGTKAFTDNLAKAGALKDKINDLTAATKSLTGNIGENLSRAAGSSIGLIASSIEGAAASQVILGDKTKDFEQTLLRLQALNGIARVAQEFGGISDKLTEIKLGFAPVMDLYTSGNQKIKDFAKNADFSFKGLGAGIKSFATGAVSGFKSFAVSGVASIKAVGAAILANPLGVILITVGAIIGIMVLLKDKIKPIADLFEFLGDVISAVGDALESVGQALGIMASESEKKSQSVIDNTEAELSAIEKRYDREIALMKAAGIDTVAKEKEKYLATQQRIKDTIYQLLLKQKVEGKLNEEELKMLKDTQEKMLDVMTAFNVANMNRSREAAEKEKEDAKKRDADAKAAAEKRKQLQKDLAQALLDISKRANDAEVAGLDGKEKLDKLKENADREVALLRETLIQKQILAGEGNKLSSEVEAQFQKLNLQNARVYSDALIQIDIDASNKAAEEQKKKIDNELEFFDLKQRLAIEAVNSSKKPNGISDEDFERQKQGKILDIQLQATKDRIDLEVAEVQKIADNKIIADQNEILKLFGHNDELSNIKRQAFEDDIAEIKARTPEEIKVLIAENDAKIVALNKQFSDNKKSQQVDIFDWDKMLGVPPGTVDKAMSQINSLKDELFAYQQQQLDGELAIIEQRQSARDAEMTDLESKLSEENDLRKQGLANNVDGIKAELEAKMAAGQADIEAQKKIQAEKKKLAKEQFIIDTALQASTMGVAIAKTLSAYAEVPPVAIAFAALEVAAFVAQKAIAFKAISQQSNFKDGVIDLQGPGTETSDSIPSNLSKGESVMTAAETKKYKPLFLGIRKNDSKLIEIGIAELLKNTSVSLPKNVASELSKTKEQVRTQEIRILMPQKNTEQEKRMASMDNKMTELIKLSSESSYLDEKGDLVIKKGNLTRIIRKKSE